MRTTRSCPSLMSSIPPGQDDHEHSVHHPSTGTEDRGLQSVGKHDGGDFGCGKTFTGCSALPKLTIKWSYVCGPDRRWHANETQIIPVCVEHGVGMRSRTSSKT